jgi:hypothetical protein
MANRLDNLKKGKPFKKGDSRINTKGRKPKLVNELTQDLKKQGFNNVTRGDINDCIETLLNLPVEKIKEIVENKKQPVLYTLIAAALLTKQGSEFLKYVIDRVAGKVTQPIDVTVPMGGRRILLIEEGTPEATKLIKEKKIEQLGSGEQE